MYLILKLSHTYTFKSIQSDATAKENFRKEILFLYIQDPLWLEIPFNEIFNVDIHLPVSAGVDAQGEDLYITAIPQNGYVIWIDEHLVPFKADQRPNPLLCRCQNTGFPGDHENIEYYYVLVWRFDLKEGEERPGWKLV